jgi:hypothetical protein
MIYDRALIIRFSIGFIILAWVCLQKSCETLLNGKRLFEVALIVFSFISSTTNAAVAAGGAPDHSTSGTNIDIILFIPGVTASLVTYLVFGTAKSWRQYRDLVVGGCGVRKKLLARKLQRDEESNRGQGFEFERLPSLRNTAPIEGRARGKEAKNRVKMFAREVRSPSTLTIVSRNSDLPASSAVPSLHQRNNSSVSHLQFHRPRPSIDQTLPGPLPTSGVVAVGLTIEFEDEVIQSGNEQKDSDQKSQNAGPTRFVRESKFSNQQNKFLFDSSEWRSQLTFMKVFQVW